MELVTGDSYLPLIDGRQQGKFILVEGRRGTGKTRAILTNIVARALQTPGSSWLLTRSTRTRLSGTVLKTLYKQVLPLFNIPIPQAQPEQVTSIPIGNGSVLVPMGLDDLQRSQSAEVSGIYVAEGVEIDQADDVLALAGAMREASGVPYFQCIVDCNPGPPGHWLNHIAEPFGDADRMIESKEAYLKLVEHNGRPAKAGYWKRVVTCHADNPYYFDAGAWQWTKAGSDYYNETLANLTGHLRQRWLYGLWVAAEGGVYPEFNVAQHVIQPFAVPEDWPVYVFYDPGYDHPCAVLWIACGPTGVYYVVDEVYGGGYTIPRLVEVIKERNAHYNVHGVYGDPQKIFSQTQEASGNSIQQQFAGLGITMHGWPLTGRKVQDQVEAVRKRLIDQTLKVFEPCKWLISEFQTWRYKRNAKGEQLSGDDQYEDRNNHALDCARGAVAQGLHFAPSAVRLVSESPWRVRRLG